MVVQNHVQQQAVALNMAVVVPPIWGRLNVERYRRMLQSELDATVRRTVESLLGEAEAELLLFASAGSVRRET